ncbi:hypothetical protein FE257_010460 [Aspergillus nanangensis]|uniref:Major facilitator superfamily (MFS) profile domain-containing protein n=1 Tax=Aspergillus nanangensis TaxID=2582783 RepID=A0AAD4CIR7_ASPNN|nr:hypothetical protein FE257_010460 [Aspergillus nanangensis]
MTISPPSVASDSGFPEGGFKAWSVVLGAWCAMIPSMGLLNSLGVLHAWTSQHQLRDYSEADIGWIYGAYAFFLYLGGAQAGPIFDAYGPRYVMIPGSVGMLAALLCLSFSEEYYQIFLSFSALGGLSASTLFTPAVSCIGHWFSARRGYATGIACTAGGLGGVIIPLIILFAAPKVGFGWSIRIIALLSAILCVIACLLVEPRLPRNKGGGASIDLKALRDVQYVSTTVAVFLVEFAVFIPITYISSYAISVGVADTLSYLLIVFLNLGAIPGRFLPGLIADRIGRFNVMVLTSTVCAILTLALWFKAGDNLAALICYAVLFGFWSGAAISLTPVCISQVCATEDYGKRNGTTFTIAGVGALIGIPIAGAIQQQNQGDYWGLIVFGGVLYMAAAVAFAPIRRAPPAQKLAPTGRNDILPATNVAERNCAVNPTAKHAANDVRARELHVRRRLFPTASYTPAGPSIHPAGEEESPATLLTPRPAARTPTPQTIQTLDALQGFSYQVIGASGESDPWLLRHCKFDDLGFLLFHHVHFRNAGGVPLEEKIPVHFLVTADQLYQTAKEKSGTSSSGERSVRDELNELVPLECGQRLVILFLRFVFPALPIMSRSQLGLSASNSLPELTVLQQMPVHLLAAIYATAQPFTRFDDYLCILNAYSAPPTDRLWRMVSELISVEIHTPHLSTLQAGILYLHREVEGTETVITDSASLWSFVGLLVGLATSLGLQFECRPMGLPAWERRLRRRLWWAIYVEDKWRCLVMGRPPYIRSDEWDVTDLADEDFHMTSILYNVPQEFSPEGQYPWANVPTQPFRELVGLARIADELQQSLYSLRSAQRLSCDFHASLEIARVLLDKLKTWHTLSPVSLQPQDTMFTNSEDAASQVSGLRFAYVLLEVFIFRALLRPIVRSATPPPLIEEPDSLAIFTTQLNNYITQLNDHDEVEPTLAIDLSDENSVASAMLKEAENCAARMLRVVMRMTSSGEAGFWHSWSRIGFATVSNFILLLLVQAPTRDHALRAKHLLDMWRQCLRTKAQGCEFLRLALIRVDGPHWTGLARNYYLPKHVKEALGLPQ